MGETMYTMSSLFLLLAGLLMMLWSLLYSRKHERRYVNPIVRFNKRTKSLHEKIMERVNKKDVIFLWAWKARRCP